MKWNVRRATTFTTQELIRRKLLSAMSGRTTDGELLFRPGACSFVTRRIPASGRDGRARHSSYKQRNERESSDCFVTYLFYRLSHGIQARFPSIKGIGLQGFCIRSEVAFNIYDGLCSTSGRQLSRCILSTRPTKFRKTLPVLQRLLSNMRFSRRSISMTRSSQANTQHRHATPCHQRPFYAFLPLLTFSLGCKPRIRRRLVESREKRRARIVRSNRHHSDALMYHSASARTLSKLSASNQIVLVLETDFVARCCPRVAWRKSRSGARTERSRNPCAFN